MSRRLRVLVFTCSVACCFGPAEAKKKQGLAIGPGPAVMSEEERALEADPAAGAEHGLILVHELERDENLGMDMKTWYHRRVKIFSNEARELANIEIPFDPHRDKLVDFWGRTILPDGTLLELTEDDLERQSVAEDAAGSELLTLKAALPGVVPGCVLDYGWVLLELGYVPLDTIDIQRAWPVREFSFRWKPYEGFPAAYLMQNADRLNIEIETKKDITITGRDIPAVVEEPLMPPGYLVRASAIVYYLPPGMDYDDYWPDVSKAFDSLVRKAAKPKSVAAAMETIALPAEGTPLDRARQLYDWFGAHLERTGLRSFEELQRAGTDDDSKGRDVVAPLFETRRGSTWDITVAFLAIARELGLDANLLAVADRRQGFWIEQLKAAGQFDGLLVALRSPADGKTTLVDPCSGLSFGEVPWYYEFTHGLLLRGKDPEKLVIPGSSAAKNVGESRVGLRFGEDNIGLLAEWTRSGNGQVGLTERRYLRRLSPEERADRIDKLCGASSDTDITEATVAALEDLNRPYELRCNSERWDVEVDEDIGSYLFGLDGPWMPSLPDLPPGERVHDVFLDYPRHDVVKMTVRAPDGFVAGTPPPIVRLESPYGGYELKVTMTESGFELQRGLALLRTQIPAREYGRFRDFIEQVRTHDRTQLKFNRDLALQGTAR